MQPFRGPGQPPSNKWPSRDPSIIGKEDWQVHESEEGHFSLLLPTEPVDLKTRLGAAWMAKTADVTVLLVSGPLQEADKGKDAKSLLKERADKDLTILKNLQLQGQPGIEMTDAKGTRLVRNYLITGWYFNIVVDTTPRVVDRKLADKIFDSFELR